MTKSGFSERAKKLSQDNFNVNSHSNSHNPGFRYHSSIHDVSHSTSTTQKQATLNSQTAQ